MRNVREVAETEYLRREHFEAALHRIMHAIGVRTQVELAGKMGIRQSSISEATRRGSIPDTWLLRLVVRHYLNPLWVLHGTGSQYLVPAETSPEPPNYEQVLYNVPAPQLLRALAHRLDRPDIVITSPDGE